MDNDPFKKKVSKTYDGGFKRPDPFDVQSKDPNYTYRFINVKKAQEAYGGQDYRGWEIVRSGSSTGENKDSTKDAFASPSLDATVRHGDLVLARMPKEKADARNRYFQEKAAQKKQALANPKDNLGLSQSEQAAFRGKVEMGKL